LAGALEILRSSARTGRGTAARRLTPLAIEENRGRRRRNFKPLEKLAHWHKALIYREKLCIFSHVRAGHAFP
jgi:hypothetical protein